MSIPTLQPKTYISYSLSPSTLIITISCSGPADEEGDSWSTSYSYWTDGYGAWWGKPGQQGLEITGPAAEFFWLPRKELISRLEGIYHGEVRSHGHGAA